MHSSALSYNSYIDNVNMSMFNILTILVECVSILTFAS